MLPEAEKVSYNGVILQSRIYILCSSISHQLDSPDTALFHLKLRMVEKN